MRALFFKIAIFLSYEYRKVEKKQLWEQESELITKVHSEANFMWGKNFETRTLKHLQNKLVYMD